MKPSILLIIFITLSFGQSAPPAAGTAGKGVTAAWDLSKDMAAMAAQTRKLQPLLERVKPEAWVAKGAPDAYVKQLKNAQNSVQYLIMATDKLAKEPERLTTALEAYFRTQSMEATLDSLRAGIERYQDGKLSQELSIAMADNSNNREKLRNYIIDLAASREQEYQVLDQEAQRCRGALIRQAPVTPSRPSQVKRLEKK